MTHLPNASQESTHKSVYKRGAIMGYDAGVQDENARIIKLLEEHKCFDCWSCFSNNEFCDESRRAIALIKGEQK